jgi:hypothetical protein
MNEFEFTTKWTARAEEMDRFDALVNGGALCRALLEDLGSVRLSAEHRIVSLAEAAEHSGYSEAHLARLVKQGRLTTQRLPGSRGRLTFRVSDLPLKPLSCDTPTAGVHELASRLYRGKGGHHGQT